MAANSKFAVAVHALAVIAHHDEQRHTSRAIAGSISTNPVVIRRLLSQLAKAGIVESTHGAKGGFTLAKPAAKSPCTMSTPRSKTAAACSPFTRRRMRSAPWRAKW